MSEVGKQQASANDPNAKPGPLRACRSSASLLHRCLNEPRIASQELSMIDRISLTEDLVFMLPGRLRLRTERGVEAPLEEAEYDDDDDAEDLSNLLRMSLCAPELETRRTTGLRPGVVLRSGILAAAARRPDR